MRPNPFAANAVRDALLPVDSDALTDPTSFRFGWVTVVNKAATPWTVRVKFADGTETDPMLCAGWYNPRVNEYVAVLKQGPATFCLGGFAGAAQVVATTATLTTVGTPATPPGSPAAPPVLTTYNLPAVSTASWNGSAWRTDTDDVIQGGATAHRGFWFYGTAVATAKGAGTIVSGRLYLERRDSEHGPDGPANVRLGVHSFTTQPGSGSAALSNVWTPQTLDRGEDASVSIPTAAIAALNAGADGFGLEPGAAGVGSVDHLIALGKTASGASGQLQLVVQT